MSGVKPEQEVSGDLDELRARIDAIDNDILGLINRRAELAEEVARVKREQPSATTSFYRPDREADVLRRIRARNQGPLPDDAAVRIIREVMSACLAVEQQLTVAFLGPWGTFTQLAVEKHFGSAVSMVPTESIDAAFREVESGAAHFAIVPIENSTEGVVTHTVDRFVTSNLTINGEVEMPIHHCLMNKSGSLDDVETVAGHPQALAQCRAWLDRRLGRVEQVSSSSNAAAAKSAAADQSIAAVAAHSAAQHYGLQLIAKNIEDDPGNATRFLSIGKIEPGPSGDDKTSFAFSTPNESGALYAMLKPLADAEISMSRIESRPSRRDKWAYRFFVDIAGHRADGRVAHALDEIERAAPFFKWLGSYPRNVG